MSSDSVTHQPPLNLIQAYIAYVLPDSDALIEQEDNGQSYMLKCGILTICYGDQDDELFQIVIDNELAHELFNIMHFGCDEWSNPDIQSILILEKDDHYQAAFKMSTQHSPSLLPTLAHGLRMYAIAHKTGRPLPLFIDENIIPLFEADPDDVIH